MASDLVSSSAVLPVVIVGLALCLVIGPIMLMRPSPRQRFLAHLRQEAARHQMSVTVAVWPERLNAPLGLMRYGLRQPQLSQTMGAAMWVRVDYPHELHVADYWHLSGDTEPVTLSEVQQQRLASLLAQWHQDAPIKAVGVANGCVYLDWVESSQLTALEIKNRLHQVFNVFDLAP